MASNDKVAELLIKAGADVNITDEVSYSHACAIVNKLVYYVIWRLTSVSCEAKKNQHAWVTSGLHDHYSELFTCTTALKFANTTIKAPKCYTFVIRDLAWRLHTSSFRRPSDLSGLIFKHYINLYNQTALFGIDASYNYLLQFNMCVTDTVTCKMM